MKQLILIGLLLGSMMPGLRAEGPPQPPRPPVAKDEPKEEPKIATGERIEIPDVGFSIVPPNGWMVHKNSHGSSLLFEAPKQPNQIYQPTIQVMVFNKLRYIDEVTMKEYGDLIVEKFGKMSNRVTGYHLRDAAIQRLETGDPSILYYTEFQYDDVPIMQMHILISSATNHFVMTYTDMAKVFEDESSPGLAIAYTSMHSAQLDSRPPWRWRGFVIGGVAVFLVILGWFTLRFLRARRIAKLGQRIEDEDNKEITRDEESQYYSRHSPTTHADSHVGDDEWASSKPQPKAAAKVSKVQRSNFDEDDEPEVSDVVPISTLEKSLHPARKRRREAAAAVPRHQAPPPILQQPVSQHQPMPGMSPAPVPPPHAHPGPEMNTSQPMHPGMPSQAGGHSQTMHPGMPSHAVNPQGMQGVNSSQTVHPGMPAQAVNPQGMNPAQMHPGVNPAHAMHPGMPPHAMNPQGMNPAQFGHPGVPAHAVNPQGMNPAQMQPGVNPAHAMHPGMPPHAVNPQVMNSAQMHPGVPPVNSQGVNPAHAMHPGMPLHAVNPQGLNPAQIYPGVLPVNPQGVAQATNPAHAMHPGMPPHAVNPQGMNPAQMPVNAVNSQGVTQGTPPAHVMPPGMPVQDTPTQSMHVQGTAPHAAYTQDTTAYAGSANNGQPAAPQHAMHVQQNPSAPFPQNVAGIPSHAMPQPPSMGGYPHAAPAGTYPQDQQPVSQHPFVAPAVPQAAAMQTPLPDAQFAQDQATTASFQPQPAYVQKAAAPATQAFSAPATPSFAASAPTAVSAMPQFAPPAKPVSEPPITESRPNSSQMSRKQPLSQNADDEPEMTEEARLSEILPKAGTIEKSKPKRKGLFWRKKTEDDDDQDEGNEEKASWNMPAAKKSKGKSEDDDHDGDSADEWAVAASDDSPATPVEKDNDESAESDAWAPEATKKSNPKRDSLLNETQGPQRLVRRTPQGPVTKEQNNAAVTEDGWNLSPEVASDHDEEDEEEVG
jgi:hypothetical protein